MCSKIHCARDDDEFEFLKTYLLLQHKALTASAQKQLKNLESARNLITQEKRKRLLEIWERLEIDDRLLSELEQELDLEETHIARAVLK